MLGGLANAPLSNKLLITFFLLMMAYAFFVSCLNFYERTNFLPKKIIHHYCGNEENLNNEELLQEGFFFPKTYREMIEIAHVHAFAVPLIIFVMSRIFSMTSIRESIKTIIYSAAFAGTIMNLSGPWLIRYKSNMFAISLIASYFILGLCFLLFISLPIYEMWFKKKITLNHY